MRWWYHFQVSRVGSGDRSRIWNLSQLAAGELAASLGLEPIKEANAGLQKAAGYTENHTQDSGLSEVVACWSQLTSPLKAAVLALVRTACDGGGHGKA
jgi:hypothetical protein